MYADSVDGEDGSVRAYHRESTASPTTSPGPVARTARVTRPPDALMRIHRQYGNRRSQAIIQAGLRGEQPIDEPAMAGAPASSAALLVQLKPKEVDDPDGGDTDEEAERRPSGIAITDFQNETTTRRDSEDGRSEDGRSEDGRSEDQRSDDQRSEDERSDDRRSERQKSEEQQRRERLIAAMRPYTGEDFGLLNDHLRERGESGPRYAHIGVVARLSRALRRLPESPGLSYRGVQLSREQLDAYQPGAIVTEFGFTSTARYPRNAFGGNTLMLVYGWTGRDVDEFSQNPGEHEVLYDRGNRFRVLLKVWDPSSQKWIIVVVQVRPGPRRLRGG
ncbi:ADP-ribosyltransferase domain-containing protein [Plantactinospora sp. WMMB334]|uniref:ADP-ribosyltransferase domain-containing protein n=1 Tax=Plantactinospora sp. WMMB334 TaxID=3404119 RepID=UPI003B931B79